MTQHDLVERVLARADEAALDALRRAEHFSVKRKDFFIGTVHIFMGLAESRAREVVERTLEGLRLSLEAVKREMAPYVQEFRVDWEGTIITPRVERILAAALDGLASGEKLQARHLLSSLLEDPDAMPVRAMLTLGASREAIRKAARGSAGAPGTTSTSSMESAAADTGGEAPAETKEKVRPAVAEEARPTPILDELGIDLTEAARRGALPPLVGREREIDQVEEILGLRRGGNPLLVGDPGVGKTAIVEGLAQRIVEGSTPSLRGCRIVALETSALLAGTGVFGSLQERVRNIIRELAGNRRVILFIDEIHTVVGQGMNPGHDVAGMLLPALASGKVRCVGATTQAEYQRFIAADGALERRFERVPVGELSREQCVEVLEQIAPHLGRHYGTGIPRETVEEAVALSERFVHHRRFPDKALRVLERAAVKASRRGADAVARDHVVQTICDLVPDLDPVFVRFGQDERLDRLGAILKEAIVGQEKAVEQVARALRRFRGPTRDDSMKPRGVFLFAGPTGVGKTLMAKTLAEFLFGSPGAMIRLDMSEYEERNTVARLIGSPPGYVGYERGGLLTNAIWARPYSIVLFDEIEKAHPDVRKILLQVFDEGWLTDAHGRRVIFSCATIIMTTNLGTGTPRETVVPGFRRDGDTAEAFTQISWEEVRHHFDAEFFGRIDEKIAFEGLGRDAGCRIIDLQLSRILKRIRRAGKELEIIPDDAAKDALLDLADFERTGAREIERCVDRVLQDWLDANWKRLREGRFRLSYEDGGFTFQDGPGGAR